MSTLVAKLRLVFYTGPLMLLVTAGAGALWLLASLFDSSGRSQHSVVRSWSRMLLGIARVRVAVEGREKIAPGGSYVFAANHRSYFDAPCILAQIPVQFRFLANRSLFRIPFFGCHLRRAGHLPVNRSTVRESLKSMSAAAEVIQEHGISVLLFPEGGRTSGELRPLTDEAAYLAIKAGVPIVPVSLLGAREILPPGSALVRGGRVRMRIGEPVPTLDLSLRDRSELSRRLRESIAETHQPAEAVRSV